VPKQSIVVVVVAGFADDKLDVDEAQGKEDDCSGLT
jgi:hypothetical protein